jgi:LmbE family N-acetylglucosaminyl deacetylase
MKLDILAGAHPDDVLGCSGTILKEVALGKSWNY